MTSIRTLILPICKSTSKSQIIRKSIINRTFATSHIFRVPALTKAITSDHREIEKWYQEVVKSNDVEHQERCGNQFIWELARHSVAEELIVYPAMEKYMPAGAGKEHAEKDRKQHHTVSSI